MRTLKKVTMDGIKRPAKYTTPAYELEIAASWHGRLFTGFGNGARLHQEEDRCKSFYLVLNQANFES
jgi:hypothetical protein